MTSGSWTVDIPPASTFYAKRVWSGGNGKTEPFLGGIRAKWNNYTVQHVQRRVLGTIVNNHVIAGPTQVTVPDARVTVGWSSNDDLRLLNKLAEEIRGHSFDLGVNIAEAGKTYGTLVQNVQSVGSALLHLKHGRISQALRALGSGRKTPRNGGIRPLVAKDLSGRWLETQYAFLPLISQSYEAGKALKALTSTRVLRFTARSSTKKRTVNHHVGTNYTDVGVYSFSKQILAELSEDISTARSLGLLNPAEVVWELVPYSFVVDWFLPIGSYLSAWGQIPKLKGRFLTTERAAWKQGPVLSGTWKADLDKLKTPQSSFAMIRTPSTSLSVPSPTFRSVPSALSPRRILSAIALIHQRLR